MDLAVFFSVVTNFPFYWSMKSLILSVTPSAKRTPLESLWLALAETALRNSMGSMVPSRNVNALW